ncbi:molybdenum cofactor guanylyltransferase MobA [Motiliproteus sediminis]|uniref:molybdenum cofactor guanylyltransferase MobA n=1 Tax=Motiliproteus sediminis TaxID=1468178 RepID=UPI001FE5B2D4|nr:molybdenum cofactor guanylyltransferase MobA [Motiliproteus sediminis]
MNATSTLSQHLSALILAGGRGQRMGGTDKGLEPLDNRPLVAHVIDRLGDAVSSVRINANRNQDTYRQLGYQVVSDELSDYQGPLAGMAAGLRDCPSRWLLVVPCDSPRLPADLAERLLAATEDGTHPIAVAHDGKRLQPVIALLHHDLLPSLEAFLARGDRKIDLWYQQHDMVAVDFSDQADAFLNINTREEKVALESVTLNS